MSVRPHKKLALVRRRSQVAELYLQGHKQADIADRVGVNQSTISDDLKCIQREWRASTVRDFDLARIEELQKLDRIEREAWAAWDRSQKPAQSATVNGAGETNQTRKSVKQRHGDPRMLEVVLKCIAARRALLGLDAPLHVSPVMANGREPFRLAVNDMSVGELRALKSIRDRMLGQTAPSVLEADHHEADAPGD